MERFVSAGAEKGSTGNQGGLELNGRKGKRHTLDFPEPESPRDTILEM
jgi:hypothetical protein